MAQSQTGVLCPWGVAACSSQPGPGEGRPRTWGGPGDAARSLPPGSGFGRVQGAGPFLQGRGAGRTDTALMPVRGHSARALQGSGPALPLVWSLTTEQAHWVLGAARGGWGCCSHPVREQESEARSKAAEGRAGSAGSRASGPCGQAGSLAPQGGGGGHEGQQTCGNRACAVSPLPPSDVQGP